MTTASSKRLSSDARSEQEAYISNTKHIKIVLMLVPGIWFKNCCCEIVAVLDKALQHKQELPIPRENITGLFLQN